tara:strand:+ start:334 stop:876 length:543 start_codon:yes stop_codon:yes gene_type:complete
MYVTEGEKMNNTKQCTKCKFVLILSQFTKDKRTSDGLDHWCKECKSKANSKWHKDPKNHERRKKAWVINSANAIKNNPQRKASAYIRRRNKYIIKNIETVSDEVCIDQLGVDRNTFKVHIESNFEKGMTWQNHGAWHQEHNIPLSKFNLLDPKQVRIANHYKNITPVWGETNLKKYNNIK